MLDRTIAILLCLLVTQWGLGSLAELTVAKKECLGVTTISKVTCIHLLIKKKIALNCHTPVIAAPIIGIFELTEK